MRGRAFCDEEFLSGAEPKLPMAAGRYPRWRQIADAKPIRLSAPTEIPYQVRGSNRGSCA